MTTSEVFAPAAVRATDPARFARRRELLVIPTRRDLWPALVTLGVTLVLALVPLLFAPSYYFIDDTAGGAYGQWYELGQQLRAGHWPMLSLSSWMAGNHLVEGQWGLYNPVVWAISLLTTVIPYPSVVATVVKLVFLGAGAVGVHLLARTYGARPSFATLAGVSAAVAGWTFRLDATAWVTNLEVWTYFPWVMAATRLFMYRRRWAWVAIVSGLLLVTVGYIQGTLMLVAMFLGLAVEAAVLRRWRALGRMVLMGIPMGLMAMTVYLPGVLSSDVTVRADKVDNTGYMTLTLNGLAVSWAPNGRPDLAGWWGRYPRVPYTYIAWFLPLALLASGRRLAPLVPKVTGAVAFLVLAAGLAIGPSELGPLRFPIRSMPWVAMMLLLFVALVLSRAVDWSGARRRLPLVIGAGALAFWMSYSAVTRTWATQVVWGAVVLVALTSWVLLQASARPGRRRALRLALVAVTACASVVQTVAIAADAAEFGNTGFPRRLSTYQHAVEGARGDFVAEGDPEGLDTRHSFWEETLWGSTWYLADIDAMNAYSPTGYLSFNLDLCLNPYYGTTCDDLTDRLFAKDPTTGVPLADLLGIDSIQILAVRNHPLQQVEAMRPPAGWEVTDTDVSSVTWARTGAIAKAGGPTWHTPGMDVRVTDSSETHVRMVAHDVPPGGGRIVLSRLDWPGYTVTGARHGSPLRDYLLTVDVPASAEGKSIDVTFRPPAWRLQVACLVLSLVVSVGIVGTGVVRSRRRRR